MDGKRTGLKVSYMWNNMIDGGKLKFSTLPHDPAEDLNNLPVPFTANLIKGADLFDKRAEKGGAHKGVIPRGA